MIFNLILDLSLVPKFVCFLCSWWWFCVPAVSGECLFGCYPFPSPWVREMGDADPPDGGDNVPPDIAMESEDSIVGSQSSLPSNELPKLRAKRVHIDDMSVIENKKSIPPSTSYQSTYCKPGFEKDSELNYNEFDKGPFIVHITRSDPDMSAGQSIRVLKFAQLIHKNKIPGIIEGGIKALGRNRVSLQFKTYQEANSFMSNDFLVLNKFTAIIPKFQISRMGVVRGIPIDWTLEELVEGIKTPFNCGQVIRARRLNTKKIKDDSVTWVPSTTVVLVFLGQSLPDRVFCYESSLPVSTYQLPTIQCRNCCRFGHIASKCRSKIRCFRCGQEHTGESCTVADNMSTCILCRGNHKATDAKCPEHSRQKAIKIVMSQDNISYSEAALRFPSPSRLYSNVTSSSPLEANSQLSQESIYPSQPSHNNSQISYTKTVYKAPRPKIVMGKSYDVQAHRDIVNTPPYSHPNGCALTTPPIESTPYLTPNDNLIELLMCTLINIINKFSDSLPYNVVSSLKELNNLIDSLISKNGSVLSTVELPKHPSQEA